MEIDQNRLIASVWIDPLRIFSTIDWVLTAASLEGEGVWQALFTQMSPKKNPAKVAG
ncbi:hypothetical protein [Nitrosomonas mobilis]|uniref:Uncharacterized protein n=1 Tax=Nitrosomonas mobilis TaxID=51642 RepID=A0A1G5SFT2_9PROT|nr:hypothetical protein [Nitrosomonas mobilis]SCZ85972.1 hypothetical protein NSMM_470041 [Nitrosomonas mobilis]HNO76039.1 hypothetical protein [Nitrosomonas mobilis]